MSICSTSIWASASVLELGSSAITLDQIAPYGRAPPTDLAPETPVMVTAMVTANGTEPLAGRPPSSPAVRERTQPGARCRRCRRWARLLVDVLDLGLLADMSTLNLMLGVSLAFFSEANFAQFLPFILAERGLDTARIATLMSCMAVADTLSKLVAPWVHARLRLSSKALYVAALSLLVACRTALVLASAEWAVATSVVALGWSKGFRTVFYYQVIPDNVPHKRLASAIGLQAVLNGIIFLAVGPTIGTVHSRLTVAQSRVGNLKTSGLPTPDSAQRVRREEATAVG